MASGFFAGGAAEGMNAAAELGIKRDTLAQELALKTRGLDQSQQSLGLQGRQLDQTMSLQTRALGIQEQGQKNAMQRDLMTRADQQVSATMALVSETTQHLIDSGAPVAKIAETVQPLIQSAKSIAAKSGSNPASLDAQLAVMLARPPSAPKFETTGKDSFGNDKKGFVDPRKMTVTEPTIVPSQTPENAPAPTDTLSGDDYIKTLQPNEAATVKAIAEGRMAPPSSFAASKPYWQGMLAKVAQYEPGFDLTAWTMRNQTRKEFNAGGPSSPAGQITAGNTAIQHLGDVSDAAEELKKQPGIFNAISRAGVPLVSYAASVLANKTAVGTPAGKALADFMTAKNHFSEEVTKFYAGSSGSEAERERALSNLDQAKSIEELRAAIKTETTLMHGKINALQSRWKNAMGPKAGEFPIVQPKTQAVLDRIVSRTTDTAKPKSALPDGFVEIP